MGEARSFKIVHEKDPAIDIVAKVAPYLSKIEPLFQQVLIGLYLRPDDDAKTPGGVIIPGAAVKDDTYQTKVGLVLKLGKRAFIDEPNAQFPVLFYGFSLKVGDWVGFRPSEGLKTEINGQECRLIADVHFKVKVDHPDDIF